MAGVNLKRDLTFSGNGHRRISSLSCLVGEAILVATYEDGFVKYYDINLGKEVETVCVAGMTLLVEFVSNIGHGAAMHNHTHLIHQ